ncbi:MAG TPA: ATP-binding protein [Solirubrobacteraceae bacterium]|nr:ATP-binding protein [Solirubrobacteraceae bacterium]
MVENEKRASNPRGALIARGIEHELRDILSVSRAAAITGPRQAGKSTLAGQLQATGVLSHYYSLDDEALRTAARADPDGFALSLARPAVIDEVQRAPALMLAVKQILDRDPTPGQFLLTGSADLTTARVIADALPGRVEYVNLWPLAQAEIAGSRTSIIDTLLAGTPPMVSGAPRGRAASAEIVLAGGYPDARTRTSRQRVRYFHSYIQTVLGRDLPEIGEVRIDPSKLDQLLRLLAARTSGMANYAALGRELGQDDKTVKAHAQLLAQLFLLYRLRPFSSNLGARQVKTPKLLLADTGMAAALMGIDESRYLSPDQGPLTGMLYETFVVMELVKQATWSATQVELFFYRDTDKREVDLVIESVSGDIVGLEVKSAASASASDARGLRLLRERLGGRFKAGVIVYSGAHTLPIEDRIWAMPISGLWR